MRSHIAFYNMRKRRGGLGPNSGLTSSVGNGDINFVTPLFQVVFTFYFMTKYGI